jgi:hypothetical protein
MPSAGDDGPRDGRDALPDGSDVGPPPPDADGDTISDADEGRSSGVDTDGDTMPDWQDLDSDGDTIPDATEAGDRDTRSPPWDNDADGIPNFRDIDSDGNGIFDAADSTGDLDGDTLPDFMDQDDDGDSLGDATELAGNPSLPPDFDADTSPDYRDADSDNDFIGDRDELTSDTDSDTVPDRFDDDSDNDTWTDAEEAGDTDLSTPPVDTDADTVPDYRDPDSDADGLADDLEREAGTSPTDADSDDDGANDMIEVAAGTGPLDPADNPRAHGDFIFMEPYNDPADPPVPPLLPDPEEDTLVFSTNIQVADVYFLTDSTGSMSGAIDNVISSLSGPIVTGLRAAIPDVQMGAGSFDDFPYEPYGEPPGWGGAGWDEPYWHEQDITPDDSAVQAALSRILARPRGYGGDGPESYTVAMYLAASGAGCSDGGAGVAPKTCPTYPEDSGPRVGYPCFRPGALPIIVLVGDAAWHNGPGGAYPYSFSTVQYADAVSAMLAIGARMIGVYVNHGMSEGRTHQVQMATDTGTVDAGGTPLVTDSADGTVSADVVDKVGILATAVPIRVDAVPVDDPSDSVDAVVSFIDYIEANASGETVFDPVTGTDRICTITDPLPVDDPADGHPDYFPRVLPGTSVCFDIHALINTTVPATREPQMFMATIQVMGDRITVLDERDVYFLVPPSVEIIIE